MKIPIHTLGSSVCISADNAGLSVESNEQNVDWSRRETWPKDALQAPGGWRTAVELEQILELGYGEVVSGVAQIAYQNFEELENDLPVRLTKEWTAASPFLLKIDRKSDVGYADFLYKYQFLLAGRPVHLDRCGYYAKRPGTEQVYRLDAQTYSLVQAMDEFNALPADRKGPQESWLTFAKVKGCAHDVGAVLDSTLQKNDVVVPSSIGLDLFEHEDGSLSFMPTCPELATEAFHHLFERNPGAEKLYSLDRPGLGKVRIVLTETQHEVLRRMKRVRRVTGDTKERLKRDPIQVFDGIADHVDLPYSERVTGIGQFKFVAVPRPALEEASMAGLWQHHIPVTDATFVDSEPATKASATSTLSATGPNSQADHSDGVRVDHPAGREQSKDPDAEIGFDNDGDRTDHTRGKKVLLIDTNEETVKDSFITQAERARQLATPVSFQRPEAFREDRSLHPHQEQGIQWLQTCIQTPGRQGVLLADDMGVGKTIQILTFLAWCIETGRLPELARAAPPFRPILIIAPLILLETQTWEREMERFFVNQGNIFGIPLSLHGSDLARFRRDDAEGAELDIGKPILDLARLQRYRVVITNYETVKNYQHSFAYFQNGKPLWSLIVSDEAQEYKVPSSKLSHAMKALKADFHIACTGTPVENRLLDLWNVCYAIQPGLLSSAKGFTEQFESRVNAQMRDPKLEELKRKLLFQKPHAFLLRRNKCEVTNLPLKHVVNVPCDMSEAEISLHQVLLKELQAQDNRSKFLGVLHRFAQLSQHPALLTRDGENASPADLVAGSSKLRTVIRQLHTIRSSREKAIIFARHRGVQSILAKVLASEFQLPVRIINGETKMKASSLRGQGAKTRNAMLNEFKSKPGFNILILSPFVAGIGLTITEANHVFHYGRWWNPAVESQATDRAYRIGQTKEVFVYIPILHDPSGRIKVTFDERLDALMERKHRLAEDFLRPLPAEDDIGDELLGELRKEEFERVSL